MSVNNDFKLKGNIGSITEYPGKNGAFNHVSLYVTESQGVDCDGNPLSKTTKFDVFAFNAAKESLKEYQVGDFVEMTGALQILSGQSSMRLRSVKMLKAKVDRKAA